MKVNPFNPNNIVSLEMFAGRTRELDALEHGLHQTKHGRPLNFLITGERGIGKSSLLNFIKHITTGRMERDTGKFNFTAINVIISNNSTLLSLIRIIEQNIKQELGKIERVRNFLDNTWSFVQRIRIMDSGIEANQVNRDLDLIINDFACSLAETCKRITDIENNEDPKDGIVFFIDEADNACPELHLGHFFKTVTELLNQHECNNIMFIVAGLPNVIRKMSESHKSSLRIFNSLVVKTLSFEDRCYVIDKGLAEGNKINNEKIIITEEAKRRISSLSEGYPHFIQQFSYSAFEVNIDGEISVDDVHKGAFNSGGALAEIGRRYYEADYHSRIQSDEYREVLSIMAGSMNDWIKKSEIRKDFNGLETTLTAALATLSKRKIILKNTSVKGEYRLQQKGFAIWIMLFGEQRKKEK